MRNDHVAERHVGHQDTGAAAGDERPAPSRDELFEEPCRERRSNSWVDEGQTPSGEGELVDRVATDLGHHVIDRATVVFGEDLLDHVLEEAENDMGGHVDRLDRLRRFDHSGRCWIELQDRRINDSWRFPPHAGCSFRDASTAPRMTNAMPAIERSGTRSLRNTTPRSNATTGIR